MITRNLLTGIAAFAFALACTTTGATPGSPSEAAPEDYPRIKAAAEVLYARGEFGDARELYLSIDSAKLPAEEGRWVEFRSEDTEWRAQDRGPKVIPERRRQAGILLEKLVAGVKRTEEGDRVWAEACESLGDFEWARDGLRDWPRAWQRYKAALDWWAGSTEIELARTRYLNLLWKATLRYDTVGKPATIPLKDLPEFRGALEKGLLLTTSREDASYLSYRLAVLLGRGTSQAEREKILRFYDEATALGVGCPWYGQSLFDYAQWCESSSGAEFRGLWLAYGGSGASRALDLYERIVRDFKPGETPGYAAAKQKVDALKQPSLELGVSSVFLPGSAIPVTLSHRNLRSVELVLYRLDLTRLPAPPPDSPSLQDWLKAATLPSLERVKSYHRDVSSTPGRDHARETFDLEPGLPQGAYLLEAAGGGQRDRQLLLVTDMVLVLKAGHDSAVVYACDAFRGAPVPGVRVKFWAVSPSGIEEKVATADKDGLVTFHFADREDLDLWAMAQLGPKQAVATTGQLRVSHYESNYDHWALYAFTDRPVYRPGQTVQWKVMARRMVGTGYETPAGRTIQYSISDTEGGKLSEGSLTLNAFGTAWASLPIPESPKLGEYSINFYDQDAGSLAWAPFFRVEEYKLPEFEVSVKVAESDGKKKAFRPGDTVEVSIGADYFSGGPVPGAEVEVTVTQFPFTFFWRTPNPYYEYPEFGSQSEQVVKRETLRADASGTVSCTFTAPVGAKGDTLFRVEAKVTDASRRQVSGRGFVRVPLHPYFVRLTPGHLYYRPKEKVVLTAEAADAYEEPVGVTGVLRVTVDEPREVWQSPEGKEVAGEELAKERGMHKSWPPPARRDGKAWILKSTTFKPREILKRDLAIGEDGKGRYEFVPPGEGLYHFQWVGVDDASALRKAETLVKVCAGNHQAIQVSAPNFQLILDKQSLHAGEPVRALLLSDEPGSWILLTVEGGGSLRPKVVHLAGTAQVVEVPTFDEDAPNAFLYADTLADQIHLKAKKEFYLRTTRHALTLEVTPDRKEVLPRGEGTFRIRTLDWRGKPVAAEVSLGVADASAYAIQADYAGDPSSVFDGCTRSSSVATTTSFTTNHYAKYKPHQGSEAYLASQPKTDGPGVRVDGIKPGGPGENGTIQGKVVDEQGQAIVGAMIIATNGALQGPRGTATNLDGEFSLPFLPQGPAYRITVEASGYGIVVQRAIAVSAGSVTELIVTLPMGDTEVYVTAAGPSWDSQRTNLTQEELESIPIDRDSASIAYLAPSAVYSGLGPENAFSLSTLVVRNDFRTTAFWKPDLVTGEDGLAEATVKFPDGLTTWRATARAATAADAFGMAQTSIRTDQPFLVRLEGPRFLVAGDETTLSAVVHNNTAGDLTVTCSLSVPGLKAAPGSSLGSVSLQIPAKGQVRADWRVLAEGPREIPVKVAAVGGDYSDGMEKPLQVVEHGLERTLSEAGHVSGDETTVILDLPENRREGSASLSVRVAPGLSSALLDALPYLVGYPYGCAEQTMSRFLPCVITAQALRDQNLDPSSALAGVFRMSAPPPIPDSEPGGPTDLKRLDDMVQKGLARLTRFQHPDGGWGWWEHDTSDRFMSSYVLWGLSLARRASVKVDGEILKKGADYLLREVVGAGGDLPLQAWMLHSFSVYRATGDDKADYAESASAFSNLWSNRKKLGDFELALFTLATRDLDKEKESAELARELAARAVVEGTRKVQKGETPPEGWRGDLPEKAHWGSAGAWWHWSQGANEKTAFALKALSAVHPGHPLADAAVTWLLGRRTGPRWDSTRDTAIVVLSLSDRLAARRDGTGDASVEVFANDHSLGKRTLSPRGDQGDAGLFTVPREFLITGANEIRIARSPGGATLYYTAEANYFGKEEPVPASGADLTVMRRYVDITPKPTLLKGPATSRREMGDGETLTSGDRVECVITVRAQRDLEYLLFEDMKPAGFEAAKDRSGETLEVRRVTAPGGAPGASAGGSNWPVSGQMEVRDDKVAFFITRLPAGTWEIRYELRAEVPGDYHVLPTSGYPMYIPGIRGNSAELRVRVRDKVVAVPSSSSAPLRN